MRFLILLLFFASSVSAQPLAVTNTFSNNTVADAADINQNFADIVNGVNAKLVTQNHSPFLAGDNNTAIGFKALRNNTSGGGNTATGSDALHHNTTGSNNTAYGTEALFYNNGQNNTAVGNHALFNNVTGYHNTATGFYALNANNPGGHNTANGYSALKYNYDGISNTGIGSEALRSNTTGDKNTGLGGLANSFNKTGNKNTAVGYSAGVNSDNLENTTAIGYDAHVSHSNSVRIGNNLVTSIGGAVAWTISSDSRLKESITPVSDGLSLVNDLHPVSYHRTNNPEGDIEMGLLAQEVEATLEKHGLGNSGMVHKPTEEAYMSLRYNDLLAPMIKAIQELDDASEVKDAEIASLKQQFQSQQEELFAIAQSQQEYIAQLQRMMGEQFASK